MEWLLIVSLTLMLFFLFQLGLVAYYRRSLDIKERLDRIEKSGSSPTAAVSVKDKKKQRKSMIFVSSSLRGTLNMAAIKMQPEEFVSMWIILAVVPAFLYYSVTMSASRALLIAIVCSVIPPFYVKRSIKKRRFEFEKQLGDSLQVLSNALRIGYSFQQALDKLSKDFPDPLGREFQLASRELLFGVNTEEALSKVAERMESADMRLLTAAVVIQQEVGGNLADILDTISQTIRDRQTIRRTIRTLTAQGRMSAWIIGLLPVFLLVVISFMNPSYTAMFFTTAIGQVMLVIAVIMELIGFAVIRKIVDIKF